MRLLPLMFVPVVLSGACDPNLKCPYGVCDIDSDTDKDTGGEVHQETVVVLEQSMTVSCDEPENRSKTAFNDKRATSVESSEKGILGGGLLVADFDGDALQDVMVLGEQGVGLWRQEADVVFVDITADTLPFFGLGLSSVTGGSLIDIDGDGDLDAYLTVSGADNHLWINDSGVFTEAEAEAEAWSGYGGGTHRTMSSAWGDMDGDNDLDLVLGGFGPIPVDPYAAEMNFELADPVILLENMGNGSFVDVSERLPEEIHDGYQSEVSWLDLDGDSRQDLIISNNYGWARAGGVVWNTEEGFVLDNGTAGFSDDLAVFGLAVGDINGDGVPDFFRSGFMEVSLLTSTAGKWIESSMAMGISLMGHQDFGWGAAIADMDNDTDLDIAVVYGYWDAYINNTEQSDEMFIYEDGSFVSQGAMWGFNHKEIGRGLVVTDLDGDGWLDSVKQQLDSSAVISIAVCGEESWLGVSLEDLGLNRFGVGAKIQVSANGKQQTRWVTAGGYSAFSSGSPKVHFGLGSASTVDSLTVTWPDGEVTSFSTIVSQQHVRVVREYESK